MGLSIHYNGSFNPLASLEQFVEEVQEIAGVFGWAYNIHESEFPQIPFIEENIDGFIYGITVTPEGCEPLCLSFLSNGRMSSELNLEFYGGSIGGKELDLLYMLSTKTQDAGIETHKTIIELLKYLSGKYLLDFYVCDEGEYWETMDESLLQEHFTIYERVLKDFSSSPEKYLRFRGENAEDE